MPVQRIAAESARSEVRSGNALLVCAYEDQDKCENYHLMHAVALDELQAHLSTLPRDRKLIFYCA